MIPGGIHESAIAASHQGLPIMDELPSLPPQSFGARLKRIGPGILLAAAAIGSGELILTPRAGAMFGISIGWVILVSIGYKLALTLGLARYTIATGEDIFEGFSHLPGPRNWFVWIMALVFLLGAVGYAGIALACGSALFAIFPALSMIQWAVVVVVVTFLLLLKGAYGPVEKAAFVLSLTLIVGVLYSLSVLQPPSDWLLREEHPAAAARFRPDAHQPARLDGRRRIDPSLQLLDPGERLRPPPAILAAADPSQDHEHFRSWFSLATRRRRVLHDDDVRIAGVPCDRVDHAGHGRSGWRPAGACRDETTAVLSRMLTAAAGPRPSTSSPSPPWRSSPRRSSALSTARPEPCTAVRIIAPRSRRWSDLAWYRAGITTLCLIIFALLFTGEPVVLIVLVSALEAPILSLSAVMLVYLLHARLRARIAPASCGTS